MDANIFVLTGYIFLHYSPTHNSLADSLREIALIMRSEKLCLLIDDDAEDTELFTWALEEAQINVSIVTQNNGVSALQQLDSGVIRPDIIFLDLNMPLMTGHEFLAQIKGRDALRHIPVIVGSTSSYEKDISDSMALGAIDYITKPTDFFVYANILRKLFETHLP